MDITKYFTPSALRAVLANIPALQSALKGLTRTERQTLCSIIVRYCKESGDIETVNVKWSN